MSLKPPAFTAADVTRLKHTVSRRSSGVLSTHDHEDIASTILVDAFTAERHTGIPALKLAGRAAGRPRYYERAAKQARRSQTELSATAPTEDDDLTPVGMDAHADRNDGYTEIEVCDLLDRLPANQRSAFVMCGLQGMTLFEVAQLTGRPLSTIHRHVKAARAALQVAWAAAEAA